MIPSLTINHIPRVRTGFHASDFGRMGFDIYHSLKGTPPSNPAKWNETLKWGAGKGVELQMLQILKDSNYVPSDYVQEESVPTARIEHCGVSITCHVDAINLDGEPVEIKSINNKNAVDIAKYKDNRPRENYVGQLAVYMDALGKDNGYLFVASIDGLSYFWFRCENLGAGVYKCGNVEVNVLDEYARWASIKLAVDSGIEPDPFEAGRYKLPLEEIDWSKLSASTISAVRTGKRVIGDPDSWKILYSPYKDMIVEKQGATLGYTEEELAKILELTKGYSSKK